MQYSIDTHTILKLVAANYDCDAYGAGIYNNESCATGQQPAPQPTPNDGLADTGMNVIIVAALGAALVIAGAILIAKKLLRRQKQ